MASHFEFLAGSLALDSKPFHQQVADRIKAIFSECHGFLGYKLTTLGRASDEDIPSFIIATKEHGIVLIDLIEDKVVNAFETEGSEIWMLQSGMEVTARNLILDLYENEVESRLRNDINLYDRKTRKTNVPITSIAFFCDNDQGEIDCFYNKFFEYESGGKALSSLESWLEDLPKGFNCSSQILDKIYSLLDGTFIYENKPSLVSQQDLKTVNDYIQRSLRTTFKQDDAQRVVSMQLPSGPQRIRGLAGTGKTIVLSIKAAITHKKFSEYKILYLFNTQSLYQHVQSLITKYYALEAKRVPDFDENLQVLHAWGGRQKPGLYSSICKKYGIIPLTLADARGRGDGLAYIYKDLLKRIGDVIVPEYDLVLIDEAQDFPNEVFELIYKITKGDSGKKRIIWAYDEFQSLRDVHIKEPAELFGTDADGNPNMPDSVLSGVYPGGIAKDFVLPNCYRTPRPILMVAHGVALGLYSGKPNDMFYESSEWSKIGYQVNEPQSNFISVGEKVEIERSDENSKNILERIMIENGKRPLKLVQCNKFDTESEQLSAVAEKIKDLIVNQSVSPEEIIIVNLRSGNNKDSMMDVQRALSDLGVSSVIPGYIESADIFKQKDFVTITTPYRAKGNEANIVFVINSQAVANDFTLRMRNAFFVSVTRSRGWCYISGFGAGMDKLIGEIEAIKHDFPKFKFTCPDRQLVKDRKRILEKSDKELGKLQDIMDMIGSDPDFARIIKDLIK